MGVLYFVAGGTIGTLNGLMLGWTVAHLSPSAPGRTVAWITAGTVLRWSLAAGLLCGAMQHGVMSALLAFTGLWIARWSVVFFYHRRA